MTRVEDHPRLIHGLTTEVWKNETSKPLNHIWNARDIKKEFDLNWKLIDAQDHLYARHCLYAMLLFALTIDRNWNKAVISEEEF